LPVDSATVARRPKLTEIRQWPASVNLAEAASALGISRSHAYELASRDEFPARIIRVGGRLIVVVADLIRLLSAEDGRVDAPR